MNKIPGIIGPHGGYRNLKSFQTAEIIYDATVKFCERFINPRSRTTDQMVQAARSGRQNIAEGSQASGTSKKTELKLVGVARASLEELLLDYQDFLRQRGLQLWHKEHPLAQKIRKLAYEKDRSYSTYRSYIEDSPAQVAANTLICLIHQANYLLDQLLRQLEKQFLQEGGFTEKLYRNRQYARKNPKNTLIFIVLVIFSLSFIPPVRGMGEKINKQAKKIYKNNRDSWEADYGDGIVMVYIPPGDFQMGSDEQSDEKPPHSVYLDGYWLAKTPVTVAQYNKFTSEVEHHYVPGWVSKYAPGDNHPVVWLSWDDAAAYCDWLSKKMGLHFQLPTEAQWEKASRGTDGRIYPWGNSQPTGNKGNFADKQNRLKANADWADKELDDGYVYTAPVGSYPDGASPYGLLDMSGNVWEWCRDWYESEYYQKSPRKNPPGPGIGRYRAARGGSWNFNTTYLRCSARVGIIPSAWIYDLGFRLCQEDED